MSEYLKKKYHCLFTTGLKCSEVFWCLTDWRGMPHCSPSASASHSSTGWNYRFVFFLPFHSAVLKPDFYLSFREIQMV